MDSKTRGEKLFILALICVSCLVLLCFTGCTGSCFGCSLGCESGEEGCVTGFGYISEGCGSEDSCIMTCNNIDFQKPYDDDSGKVLLLSCEATQESCSGESGYYSGTYCGGCSSCGSCGVFCGQIEDHDVDEMTFGCVDGCFGCGDTDDDWNFLLNFIYAVLELK